MERLQQGHSTVGNVAYHIATVSSALPLLFTAVLQATGLRQKKRRKQRKRRDTAGNQKALVIHRCQGAYSSGDYSQGAGIVLLDA